MCGRFSQTVTLELLEKRFELSGSEAAELKPRYNIAPTQDAAVVVAEGGGRALRLFRFGLIPSWAKDARLSYSTINARAETLREKPAFKKPFERSRCLVVADGYYEWREGPGKTRLPSRVARRDRAPFAMAGVWDSWKDPAGKLVRSFAVVTAPAAEALRALHDRMPAILEPGAEAVWLDPKASPESLLALLAPRADELEAYPVSTAVNSPKNDTPACLEPPPA